MKGCTCRDGFHLRTGWFVTWPFEIFFSGASEMGVWGVELELLIVLEDDGKAYAKADKWTAQHIFVGDKPPEKILFHIFLNKSWLLKNIKIQNIADFKKKAEM